MKSITPTQSETVVTKIATKKQTLSAKLLIKQLGKIQFGRVTLVHTDGSIVELGKNNPGLHVTVNVHNERFYKAVLLGGSVGAAESYVDKDWDVDNLTGLIQVFARNRDILDAVESTTSKLAGISMKLWHAFNRNTQSGSRKNIAAHYDLGNDMFELFLDKDWMMYSSGVYHSIDDTLEQAQYNKLKRLCDKLDLQPEDHVVEIGTGWGGCAAFAAKHYGCHVTTTTISKEQFDYAVARVKKMGLEDKVTVLLEDYRDLLKQGKQYDKLISIEMVEAVGHQYLDQYFETCSALLKDDGLAVIQAITIEDTRYLHARDSVDFIKRYIFPGSFIPCVSVLSQSSADAGLRMINLEDIGESYAYTLREWRRRFFEFEGKIKALGYPEEFMRLWDFYFCYCEGGFLEKSISDAHLLFAKPYNQRDAWLS